MLRDQAFGQTGSDGMCMDAFQSQPAINTGGMNPNYNPRPGLTGSATQTNWFGQVGSIKIPQFDLPAIRIEDIMAINNYPITRSFTVGVTSTLGAGAVDKQIFLINELPQALDNRVTNNGSGAASISYSYPDNFDGRSISRLCSNGRFGVGLVCTGVALRILNNNDPDPIALSAAEAKFMTNTFFKNPVVLDMDMSTRQARPDQDLSIEVIPCLWNIGPTTQFSFKMPGNEETTVKASTTFYLA